MSVKPGGGKYDREVTAVLTESNADVVLLVVIGGARGNGFSVAITDAWMPAGRVLTEVPAMLRAIADSIEVEQKGMS